MRDAIHMRHSWMPWRQYYALTPLRKSLDSPHLIQLKILKNFSNATGKPCLNLLSYQRLNVPAPSPRTVTLMN